MLKKSQMHIDDAHALFKIIWAYVYFCRIVTSSSALESAPRNSEFIAKRSSDDEQLQRRHNNNPKARVVISESLWTHQDPFVFAVTYLRASGIYHGLQLVERHPGIMERQPGRNNCSIHRLVIKKSHPATVIRDLIICKCWIKAVRPLNNHLTRAKMIIGW